MMPSSPREVIGNLLYVSVATIWVFWVIYVQALSPPVLAAFITSVGVLVIFAFFRRLGGWLIFR